MITREKIKIFDSYGGDIDGLARVGNKYERDIIEDEDWSLIENFYHDIGLINKGLAAQTYIEQTIRNLKYHCDNDSFNFFANRIECYKDFQNIANILKQIRNLISKDSDTSWAGYDNADKFLEDLNHDIEQIEACDYSTLKKVHVEFLPTCTYQELSISNGWTDLYIQLSTEFDNIYVRLTEIKPIQKSILPTKERKWWQKLFGLMLN